MCKQPRIFEVTILKGSVRCIYYPLRLLNMLSYWTFAVNFGNAACAMACPSSFVLRHDICLT